MIVDNVTAGLRNLLRNNTIMSTYSELLKHPEWQKKRLLILQRDEWKCVECQDTTDTLHVHHLTYESGKAPWEYEDSNFVTMCEVCHAFEESLKNDPVIRKYAKAANVTRTYLWCMVGAVVYAKINEPDVFDRIRNALNDGVISKDNKAYNKFLKETYKNG